DHLYGPKPGVPTKPVVIVLDNGPVHVSKATAAALAARAHWLTVEWLPKYAPELNDIEVVWHDLKAFRVEARGAFCGLEPIQLERLRPCRTVDFWLPRKTLCWRFWNRTTCLVG